jgi:hypothetical protein
LYALIGGGYTDEARARRDWLMRSVAGEPSDLQIMYGAAGERRLPEMELPWLPDERAAVRVGNAAARQRQPDVYGEVLVNVAVLRQLDEPPSQRIRQRCLRSNRPVTSEITQRAALTSRVPGRSARQQRRNGTTVAKDEPGNESSTTAKEEE